VQRWLVENFRMQIKPVAPHFVSCNGKLKRCAKISSDALGSRRSSAHMSVNGKCSEYVGQGEGRHRTRHHK
jgi:hypothetical protein